MEKAMRVCLAALAVLAVLSSPACAAKQQQQHKNAEAHSLRALFTRDLVEVNVAALAESCGTQLMACLSDTACMGCITGFDVSAAQNLPADPGSCDAALAYIQAVLPAQCDVTQPGSALHAGMVCAIDAVYAALTPCGTNPLGDAPTGDTPTTAPTTAPTSAPTSPP
ncbi:hypothetical protein JKP88DRAFT_217879 [Tribonema minus]|uniref:Uncharacterized protein n=1 Tax=Tribonema minus TaxID=303371 RepID=A0A835Z7D3_9STRA|nr:hypothetical protein JKP88DRAFT_217879 [Tribonema minus]